MRTKNPAADGRRVRIPEHDAAAYCADCVAPRGAAICHNSCSPICYDSSCTRAPCTIDHTSASSGTCCDALAPLGDCMWAGAPVHWGPVCYEESHVSCCTSVCDGYVDSCSEYVPCSGGIDDPCFAGCEHMCPSSVSLLGTSGINTPLSETSLSLGPSTPHEACTAPAFTCEWGHCGATFPSSEALITHVNTVHMPTSQVGTMAHEMMHTNNIKHDCGSAQVSPSWHDVLPLLESAAGAAPDTSLECPWGNCSHEAGATHNYRVPDLLQHLLSVHLDHIPTLAADAIAGAESPAPAPMTVPEPTPVPQPKPDGQRPHQCCWIDCSDSFDTHYELTQHVINVHVGSGKPDYICRWRGCARAAEGRAFGQRQKLLRHIHTHTGYKPHVCTVCAKRFSEPGTLAQHMRTHTNERPFKCDFPGCNKSFSVMGSLTIHKRIHSGVRPFKCPYPGCERSFCESSNLHKHLRVHRGERYVCGECGAGFSDAAELAAHRKTHMVIAGGDSIMACV